MDEKYMTPKEVMEYLHVSQPTVSRLMRLKGFPAVRIGRCARVKKSALDAYLEDNKKIYV